MIHPFGHRGELMAPPDGHRQQREVVWVLEVPPYNSFLAEFLEPSLQRKLINSPRSVGRGFWSCGGVRS